MDVTRAAGLSPEVAKAIDDLFEYHPWDEAQREKGKKVREALASAVKVIVDNVPPCASRSVAIRKVFEARMDANAAITHHGQC